MKETCPGSGRQPGGMVGGIAKCLCCGKLIALTYRSRRFYKHSRETSAP